VAILPIGRPAGSPGSRAPRHAVERVATYVG
jgi:hypothetical protein